MKKTPNRENWAAFALAGLCLSAAGCNTEDNNPFAGIEDALKEGYAFEDACNPESDLTACGTCCEGLGYDDSAVFGDDECGCSSTESDDQVCAGSADCRTCCLDDNDEFTGYFSLGDSCSCTRQVDQPLAQ